MITERQFHRSVATERKVRTKEKLENRRTITVIRQLEWHHMRWLGCRNTARNSIKKMPSDDANFGGWLPAEQLSPAHVIDFPFVFLSFRFWPHFFLCSVLCPCQLFFNYCLSWPVQQSIDLRCSVFALQSCVASGMAFAFSHRFFYVRMHWEKEIIEKKIMGNESWTNVRGDMYESGWLRHFYIEQEKRRQFEIMHCDIHST